MRFSVVEHLPSKYKALSSNSTTTKKKKEEKIFIELYAYSLSQLTLRAPRWGRYHYVLHFIDEETEPGYPQGIGSGLPKDAQILYLKWFIYI
jgi:hypothetical protein